MQEYFGSGNKFLAAPAFEGHQRPSVVSLDDTPKTNKILVTTGEKSTVHGFPSISSSKAFSANKILWIVSLLVAWAYGIYGVYGMVVLFMKYEKITTISSISEGMWWTPLI